MRRVVITGLGMLTPLACGVEETWERLLAGKSGAGRIRHFDASHLPSQIACEIPLGDGSDGTFDAELALPTLALEYLPGVLVGFVLAALLLLQRASNASLFAAALCAVLAVYSQGNGMLVLPLGAWLLLAPAGEEVHSLIHVPVFLPIGIECRRLVRDLNVLDQFRDDGLIPELIDKSSCGCAVH